MKHRKRLIGSRKCFYCHGILSSTALADGYLQGLAFAPANDFKRDCFVNTFARKQRSQILRILESLAIHPDQYIAKHQATSFRGTASIDQSNTQPLCLPLAR